MKIAVRCIFTHPITPNFLIIDLKHDKWQEFFCGDKYKRIEIVGPYLPKAHCAIREISWIPLDGLSESDKSVLIINLLKNNENNTNRYQRQGY